MNRNQKIAIGCGAAGCLGLVLVAVIAAVAYFAMSNQRSSSNANRSRIFNLNSNSSGSTDTTANDSGNSNTASSEETTASSLSDDDKHKLFQASAVTQDTVLIQRVWKKIGLAHADGTPNDQYKEFMKDHVAWLFKNTDFIQEVNTPEKARAYVEEHLND
jgi:hypothetical protein